MCRAQLLGINCDFEVIYLSVIDNIDYFFFVRDNYWYGDKFVSLLRELLSHLQWYENNLKELCDQVGRFDFSVVKGNGFRSFCLIYERCFTDCYKFCKRLSAARSSLFFRAGNYLKETECLVSILFGLRPGLDFLFKIMSESRDNQLLMPDKALTVEELIIQCGGISQLGFYGRYQGFYYCTSMRRILQGVGVIVATFSDLYRSSGGPITRAALTLVHGLKYILYPELRAEQIVDVAQNSSVEFLKAFWSLSETQLMKRLPNWICPSLKVRSEIWIPAKPITLISTTTNTDVVIPVPSAHIPEAPVRCLFLSLVHREGQDFKTAGIYKSKVHPKSKSLLFHCHGGGFISQNPESHEIYLRHWAHDLNVPIISVDYSLAPEAPFPRALEEILLTYAWVLNNPEKLGWTGERICFAGDSAGGNLLMGIVLKCVALDIRRPDSILCAYTPLILDVVPSPSRLLCWIDPLLPLGFMISCLGAYAGKVQTDDEYVDELEAPLSGRSSRKISSISEILDSGMSFLKPGDWTEVEANEPVEHDDSDSAFYGSDVCIDIDPRSEPNGHPRPSHCPDYSSEHAIFDFPHDALFDLRTKCRKAATLGLTKISRLFMSTYLYQKVISPLVPSAEYAPLRRCDFKCVDKSNITQKLRALKIMSRNPFMSPLLASDEVLREMPPLYFMSLNFDPCLDDSIHFSKRLQSLNRHVVLDVLDGLPHGFLNFLPFSQEAHNGSNQCVRRLKEGMMCVP